MILQKIPPMTAPDTEGVVLAAVDEPFVDLAAFSGGRVLVDMQYKKQGRPGATDRALLRRGAAERLLKAANALPKGYRLLVYDAWRPYAVQKDIYDEYFKAVAEDPENRGLTDDALHALTARFVSRPARGKPLSFVHSSGGAVDLTLADEQGRPLDMGCGFDEFTPLAATNALENANTPARDNRRLLYTVMINAGFTNYAAEWWHFDFGDLFYAAETKTAARYASIYDEGEITYDKSAPSL